MATLSVNAYYRESQITTVGRGQLLLLVYDGMLRFLGESKRAMAAQQYEAQNTSITKTQALLMELVTTLDHTIMPELARNLDRLYRYMYDRLTHANVHDDEQALMEVARMVADLRETWAEADRLTRADGTML